MRSHQLHAVEDTNGEDQIAALDRVSVHVSTPGVPATIANDIHVSRLSNDECRALLNAYVNKELVSMLGVALDREPVSGYSHEDRLAFARAFCAPVPTGEDGKPVYTVVAGKTVEPWTPTLPDAPMTLAEQAVDQVRFDTLLAAGKLTGTYEQNRTAADVAARAEARGKIRQALDTVCKHLPGERTYRDLIVAKAAEIASAQHPRRTRNAKKSEAVTSLDI